MGETGLYWDIKCTKTQRGPSAPEVRVRPKHRVRENQLEKGGHGAPAPASVHGLHVSGEDPHVGMPDQSPRPWLAQDTLTLRTPRGDTHNLSYAKPHQTAVTLVPRLLGE